MGFAVFMQGPPRAWNATAPAPAQHAAPAPGPPPLPIHEPSQQHQRYGQEGTHPGAAAEPLVTVGSGRVGSSRSSGRGVVLAEVQPQRTL